MNAVETEFRDVEKTLDKLIKEDEDKLRSGGFQVTDHSARTYHYKNDHLFWDYWFRKEWLIDIERACVTVRLTYGEPVQPKDEPVIKLSWRAEVYRQGQESRIDKRSEKSFSLSNIKSEGISYLVTKAFEEGSTCLPSAL